MNSLRLILVTVLLGISLVSCKDARLSDWVYSSPPADQILEQKFFEKKELFEKLVAMSDQDAKVVRIAKDFTWLKDDVSWPREKDKLGFSTERWSQYKVLFKQLDIPTGVVRGDSTMSLAAFTSGLVTGGLDKGYLYSKTPPFNLVDSLDQIEVISEKRFASKKIAENWYLYLSR